MDGVKYGFACGGGNPLRGYAQRINVELCMISIGYPLGIRLYPPCGDTPQRPVVSWQKVGLEISTEARLKEVVVERFKKMLVSEIQTKTSTAVSESQTC